jgi:multiple sugar transport system ATP-binding protein
MVVARLDPESDVKQGEETELWLDASKVQYFDGDSGQSLSAGGDGADGGAAA